MHKLLLRYKKTKHPKMMTSEILGISMTNQDNLNHRLKDQIKQKMTLEISVISIVNLFRLKRQKS